jgi:1-acyl-sn-glycerol-3-phosphate acyltransferase
VPRTPLSVLVGVISTGLLFLNTVVWATPIYVLALIKLCCPPGRARQSLREAAIGAARNWVSCNNLNFSLMATTTWDVRGLEHLRSDGSYLIVANHQSWADIVVLQKVFSRRIPFLMFFIKKELVWVPVLGLAWKGLDFPFMQRSSKKHLEKHPEMKQRDLDTTRALCAKLRGQPLAIMNFLEGTRFDEGKHAKQDSRYRHLLKPKAGGVAFVMNAIGDQLDALLDVSIVYPGGQPTIWEFMSGRVPHVIVDVRERQLPRDLVEGDYSADAEIRERTQQWVADLWDEKDATLERILAGEPGPR